mmetsp:Transcript_5080/g.14274  ORF Transcript_5080/g.14274 Transcript_5080/m.14274 type:complete len:483 (+) Transcript_5080:246-1694(+)|eukprot:CAMPEP_0168745008 /NCGR_PEP_ID=MMETSP0724-20121128/14389_1 /TAXON_ID=265536 /ORGANISM="Amphiprora sp., Strain CCMP467" /LENGTH=482 /DNA_ID=CAMNT_0008792693 /DNA_START=227 /DNA_END=1675 /DNA_ORIENTATION=-
MSTEQKSKSSKSKEKKDKEKSKEKKTKDKESKPKGEKSSKDKSEKSTNSKEKGEKDGQKEKQRRKPGKDGKARSKSTPLDFPQGFDPAQFAQKFGKKKEDKPAADAADDGFGTTNGADDTGFETFDGGFGSADAFGGNAFATNAFEEQQQLQQQQPAARPAPRQRLRARRRASIGVPTMDTSGATSGSEDDMSQDGAPTAGVVPDQRRAPQVTRSADNLDIGNPTKARPPRRRARRQSAIGGIGMAGGISSKSFSGDGGYEYETSTATQGDPQRSGSNSLMDQYGYGNGAPETTDYGYGTDDGFGGGGGSFSASNGGGRAKPVRDNSRRMSSDSGGSGEITDDDPVAADRQRKLMDDIAFGDTTDYGYGGGGGGGGGSSDFMVPMADAAAAPSVGEGHQAAGGRRQRIQRRASLGFVGGVTNNHQTLSMDDHEKERKQKEKTGFFKDRSDKKKVPSGQLTKQKSNEKLTGYDFDRDRRRFMG